VSIAIHAPRYRRLTPFALLDDILTLLKPSLAKHKGCTIIDLFPGEGLWSRKLHDVVQPKLHHIIEPVNSVHAKTWQEMVKTLGPEYILSPTSVNLDKVVQISDLHTLLPASINEGSPDIFPPGSEQQTNNSVLFLVNLARFPHKATTNKVPRHKSPNDAFTHLMLEQFRHRSGFQKDGAIRALMWTTQNDKYVTLPRTILKRSAKDGDFQEVYFGQEIACEHGHEFMGRRPPVQDVESADQTLARMQEQGIEIPAHRRSKMHQALLDSFAEAKGKHELPQLMQDVQEIYALERVEVLGGFSEQQRGEEGDKRKRKNSAEVTRLAELRQKLDDLVDMKPFPASQRKNTMSVVIATLNLFAYEQLLRRQYPDGPKLELHTDEERTHMKSLQIAVEDAWNSHSGRERRRVNDIEAVIDNSEALRLKLLDWDNRPYEPLGVLDSEFDPPYALALLDYQPRPRPAFLKAGRSIIKTPFITLVRYHLESRIGLVLDQIAHGAAEALLPQCPTISDPAKGGHVHLEHVRVRVLTYEMLVELNAAWEAWPFKLPDAVLKERMVQTYI